MSPAVVETLYLGTEKDDRVVVTTEQWKAFLETVVTPAFPEGFTTWQTYGQWRDRNGRIDKEDGYVLQFIHSRDESIGDRVKKIADEYNRRFEQKAVLYTTETACETLITSSR